MEKSKLFRNTLLSIILIILMASQPSDAKPLISNQQPEAEYTPEMQAAANALFEESDKQNAMYDQYMRGNISSEEYKAFMKEYCEKTFMNPGESYEIASENLPLSLSKTQIPNLEAFMDIQPFAIGDGTKKFLSGETLTQENDYYCGPASEKLSLIDTTEEVSTLKVN